MVGPLDDDGATDRAVLAPVGKGLVRDRVGVKVGVRVRVTCTVRVYKYTVLYTLIYNEIKICVSL